MPHRTIEHTALVRRSMVDIEHILGHHAAGMLEVATAAATHHVSELVMGADAALPHFDRNEPLAVVVGDPGRHRAEHAWIEFSWTADRRKRLLANVDARLDIVPLRRTRPAVTELTLRARYAPVAGPRSSPETILFGRRVVKAATRRLLDAIVDYLETFEEVFVLPRDDGPQSHIEGHVESRG